MAEGEWSLPLLTRKELADPFAWVTIRGEERQLWQVGHLFGVTYDIDGSTGTSGVYSSKFRGMYLRWHQGQTAPSHLATRNATADRGQFLEPLTCLSDLSGSLAPGTPHHSKAHEKYGDHSPRIREMLAVIDGLVDESWFLQVGEEGTNDAIAETEAILTGTVPEGGWASLYPRPLAIKSDRCAGPSKRTLPSAPRKQHERAYGQDMEEEAAPARPMLTGAVSSPRPTREPPRHPRPEGASDSCPAGQTTLVPTSASREHLGVREAPTPLAQRETGQRASVCAGRRVGRERASETRSRQAPPTTPPRTAPRPPPIGDVGASTREHKPATAPGTARPAAAPISILKQSRHDGIRNAQHYMATSAQQAWQKAAASSLLPYPLPSFLQNPPSFLQHPPEFLQHPPHEAQTGVGDHDTPELATPRSSRNRARTPAATPTTPIAATGQDDPGLVSRWSPDSSDSPRPSRLKKVKKALSFASLRLRARKSGVFQRQSGDRANGEPGASTAGTRASGSSGGSSVAKGSTKERVRGGREKHN